MNPMPATRSPGRCRRGLDALFFSGLWVAIAAGALTAAAATGFGTSAQPAAIVLAVAGTFTVYGVDRLRDLDRDAATSPLRTAFVVRHRRVLAATTGVTALVALGATRALGGPAMAMVAFAGGFGLLHRRFKGVAFFKAGYVTAAWLAVTVGLPAATAAPPPRLEQVAWVCGILGPALFANAVAFSARDAEAAAARLGERIALRLALAIAVSGVVVGILAPAPARTLTAVPFATAIALAGFRRDERYVHGIVDGTLIAGAVLALCVG